MSEFKVGDRVRIRQWNDMEEEYGTKELGGFTFILCKHFFSSGMKHLCGRHATIKNIDGEDVTLKNWSDDSGIIDCNYSTEVIEKVDTETKMAKVAALLGVTLGENFDIENVFFNPYKITEKGLIDRGRTVRCNTLYRLLVGELKIIKRPFKPAMGDIYWLINETKQIESAICRNDVTDYIYIKYGNCFRTLQEAEANKSRILNEVQEFFNKK